MMDETVLIAEKLDIFLRIARHQKIIVLIMINVIIASKLDTLHETALLNHKLLALTATNLDIGEICVQLKMGSGLMEVNVLHFRTIHQ
jgi:hypothetical protein